MSSTSPNSIQRDWVQIFRLGLELVVLLGCMAIVFFGQSERDDAAAWSIIGIVVASIVRNLAR